jgi:hypothetical protein
VRRKSGDLDVAVILKQASLRQELELRLRVGARAAATGIDVVEYRHAQRFGIALRRLSSRAWLNALPQLM